MAITLTTLASFNVADGEEPNGTLVVGANGDLFGTTSYGGAYGVGTTGRGPSGYGTVFEIVKTATGYASTPTTLVSFNGIDGADPQSGLMADANGNLFGTTAFGGTNGNGTVFEITKTATGYASVPTVLVSFAGTDGMLPRDSLIADVNGDLFGTTSFGGAYDDGTVFEVMKSASGYASIPTTLVSFDYTNGSDLWGSPVADANGNLFGTTMVGGQYSYGTLFEVARTASGYASTPTTLVNFTLGSGMGGLVADANGNLFGTTGYGGAYGDGTVNEVARNASGYASTPTTLANFNNFDGYIPTGSLIVDANGNLFGTTIAGGAGGAGTVFEIAKTAFGYASTPTTLVSFNNADGSGPSSLVADANGNLFGTTDYGGANGDGTVFEITGSGYTVKAITVADGDTYTLSHVELMATTLNISALNFTGVTPPPPAVATLDDVTIDSGSTINMVGATQYQPILNLIGATVNDGTINIETGASGGGTRTGMTEAQIMIGRGGRFTNNGAVVMHTSYSDSGGTSVFSNQFDSLNMYSNGPGATFVNNGIIDASKLTIDTALLGHGTIVFMHPEICEMGSMTSRVELDEYVGSRQVIDMTNPGNLTIGDLRDFHGTVNGFSGMEDFPGTYYAQKNSFTIPNFDITNVSFAGNATGGTLTLLDGNDAVGSINLTGGDYRHANFTISHGTTSSGASESVLTMGGPSKMAPTSDFNGDGTSDILFRDPTGGGLSQFVMNNGQPSWAAIGWMPPSWNVVDVGDLNGDGTSDILFRDSTTGGLGEYIMYNGQPTWASIGWAPRGAWDVTGIGDFNGDGTSGILFHDPTGGGLGELIMKNGQPIWDSLGWVPPTLQVVGVGDFNGDGSSDILFRDPTGGALGDFTTNNNQPSWASIGWVPPSWNVVGVGDFNGDGTSDILFRDPISGGLGDFIMDNGQATWASIGWMPPSWQVVGVGDYNGDGTSDILFRDPTGGGIGEFTMRNNQPTWAGIGWAAPNWQVAVQ